MCWKYYIEQQNLLGGHGIPACTLCFKQQLNFFTVLCKRMQFIFPYSFFLRSSQQYGRAQEKSEKPYGSAPTFLIRLCSVLSCKSSDVSFGVEPFKLYHSISWPQWLQCFHLEYEYGFFLWNNNFPMSCKSNIENPLSDNYEEETFDESFHAVKRPFVR